MLSLDPGQTTGWAVFEQGYLTESGHVDTSTPRLIRPFLEEWAGVDVVVCESYHIYPEKLAQHANSAVYTVQVIGAIRYAFESLGTPLALQPASVAKSFCTDDKLRAWGMWSTNRHSRDAIRHGIWWLLFNKG